MINELIDSAVNWFIPNFHIKLRFLILLSILLFIIKICYLKCRCKINFIKSYKINLVIYI